MFSLSQGLPADPAYRRSHADAHEVQAPADGLLHNGKLNMGPAICVAVSLSLLGWVGIFGAGYMLLHLI